MLNGECDGVLWRCVGSGMRTYNSHNTERCCGADAGTIPRTRSSYQYHYRGYDLTVGCAAQRQRYPSLYVTASYNDTRVGYWEPAKWVARLRERATPQSGVVLLQTELEGGHFGTGGRVGYLADAAREYAFLYLALDLDHGARGKGISRWISTIC